MSRYKYLHWILGIFLNLFTLVQAYPKIVQDNVVVPDCFVRNFSNENGLSRNGVKNIMPDNYVFGEFYICHYAKIKHHVNWKKPRTVKVFNKNFWNLFRLGQNQYLLNDNRSKTLYEGFLASKEFNLDGDILTNSNYRHKLQEIKLYWNNVTNRDFLYLNKNLYSFEVGKSGNIISTRILINNFDLEAESIINVYYDKSGGRAFLESGAKGLFILIIKLTIPYFGKIENLGIAYAGTKKGTFPKNWFPVGNDNTIQISGGHTVYIKKKNGFGLGNFTNRRLIINVKEGWFETMRSKAGVIIFLVAIVFAIIKLQGREKNRELEIDKRIGPLNQALEALQDSENELARQVQIQSKILVAVSPDVRSPLKTVTYIAGYIPTLIANKQYDLAIEVGKSIAASTSKINAFLDSMLDYIKVQMMQSEITFEKFSLYELVDQKIRLFSLSSDSRRNQFLNQLSKNIFIQNNPSLFGIIIHNIVNNVNKNTYNGMVKIFYEMTTLGPRLLYRTQALEFRNTSLIA